MLSVAYLRLEASEVIWLCVCWILMYMQGGHVYASNSDVVIRKSDVVDGTAGSSPAWPLAHQPLSS